MVKLRHMKNIIVLFLLLMVYFTACVSPTKYQKEVKLKQDWEDRSIALAKDLQNAQEEMYEMRNWIAIQEERIERLKRDSLKISELNNRFMNRDSYRKPKIPATNFINQFQLALLERDSVLKSLKYKFGRVLDRYSEKEVRCSITKGLLKISMSDNMLYGSGSIRLKKEGLRALANLAIVLSNEPNVDIIVEGHTDNIPIRRKGVRDNWDLSVLRASTLVRVLIRDFDIAPKQLVASGRGEHYPRATNTTKVGQAMNRRTEIVVVPRIQSMDDLVGSHL